MKMLCGFCMLVLPLSAGAAGLPPDADFRASGPRATFSNDSYQLGYEVFLKNGDLQAAYQVARKALLSRPDDLVWLKAFAQVAEWTGQPAEALKAWARLAHLTGSQQAWGAVGRLAPSLLDDEELLAYQEQALTRDPGNGVLIREIARIYERLGRVEEGLAFFSSLEARQTTELLLDVEATMAEHSGRDELALSLLDRLNREYGPREGWLLRIAALHYLHGDQAKAWDTLHDAELHMPAKSTGYWQTYAQLSGQLNHKQSARKAFQTLVDAGGASTSDLLQYVSLLENEDGLAAARLSETLFRAYGLESAMVTALFLYQREHHITAAIAMLALPSPEQQANLERNPDFLEQRGQLEWQQHDFNRANADFARGLSLRKDSLQLILDLVSLAVDQTDKVTLRQLLPKYSRRAIKEPGLWMAWANGWSALGRPSKALPFLKSYCRQHPRDEFALLVLAETYASSGDVVMAASLRQRVLVMASRPHDSRMPADRAAALNDALIRLRLEKITPDAGRGLITSRLRTGPDGKVDPASRDLMLGWLLAQGSEEKASAWMNTAYHGDAPVWAEVGVADSSGDGAALQERLMTPKAGQSASETNVLAGSLAKKLDWAGLGETAAFETLELNPDSEVAAEDFNRIMSRPLSSVALQADVLRQSSLDRRQAGVWWSAPAGAAWQLGAEAGVIRQHNSDPRSLGNLPSGERQAMQAGLRTANGSWNFSLSRTSLLSSYLGGSLEQHMQLGAPCMLYWRADRNADAPESAPLLAVGAKDSLEVGITVAVADSLSLSSKVTRSRFNTQHGDALGDGSEISIEAKKNFTFSEIRQALSLTAMQANFSTTGNALPADVRAVIPPGIPVSAGFFIPTSFRQAGLHWLVGDSLPVAPESRWQLSGQVGVSHADSSGFGYDGGVDMRGPVLGNDRLRLLLMQGKSGQNSGSIVQQATATYQYFY